MEAQLTNSIRQPMVLVIDDDHEVAAQVQQAVPDWAVHAAYDGVSGIAFVRTHWEQLDLIILDVRMPHDGIMVCAQVTEETRIHGRSTPLRILPYTGAEDASDMLAALGCAPTLLKPATRDLLRLRMYQALGLPATPPPANPLLPYLQRMAARSEYELTQQYQFTTKVAILGSARMLRSMLREAVTAAGGDVRIDSTSATNLEAMLAQLQVTVLVADSGAHAAATTIAHRCGLSLLVIGLTMSAAYRALDTAQGVVVGLEDTATLATALIRVAAGDTYHDPLLTTPFNQYKLSATEQTIASLLLRGWRTGAIATSLCLQLQTVREYRSKIYTKMSVTDVDQIRERINAWRNWNDSLDNKR
jgi:DNA-binding NarL/FixJ family response regulator